MPNSEYKLRYLPLFYEDLKELERLPIAESFETYPSLLERKHPYYRIYVDNFIVFYVVIDTGEDKKIMEVRRFLYKGQDRDSMI